MATVTRTLDIARAEIGTVGGQKYRAPFGVNTGAWCAYFVCWVLRTAGMPTSQHPWTGWTPGIVTWAKDRGRWKTTDPRPGDLVLFMWPDVSSKRRGTPPVCHVGIVEAVNADGSLTTIEGNTSGNAGGSQYNGNLCARRRRSSNIQGFVALTYDASTPPGTPRAPAAGEGGEMRADERAWLFEIHHALGAGGSAALPESETVLGIERTIRSQVNGLPGALSAIQGQVNGVPDVLAGLGARLIELAGVLYAGTPGTPPAQTVYQRVARIESAPTR